MTKPNPELDEHGNPIVLTQPKDGGEQDPPIDPPVETDPPQDPPKEPKEGDEDYKAKFQASSSEANRLREIAIANGIDPKTGKPVEKVEEEPEGTRSSVHLESNRSDEELGKDIPGFEFLSEDEKATIIAAKRKGDELDTLINMVAKIVDKDEFARQIAQLVAQPEFVSLAGDSAFKAYAYKKENLQTPLTTLARAYLFDKKPAEVDPEPVEPENGDRPGLESGGGHDRTPPSDKGVLTVEQIAHLRQNDPKRYMRLIKEGKIRSNLK